MSIEGIMDKKPLDITTGKVYYDPLDRLYTFVTFFTLWTVEFYYLHDPNTIHAVSYDYAEEAWEDV